MKKFLVIFALAAFLGSTAAPSITLSSANHLVVVDKDPKTGKEKKANAEKEKANTDCTKSCKNKEKTCDKKSSEPKK